MKRADNVFFFVLIDFFLQVVFLGLVLYGVSVAAQDPTDEASDAARLAQLERLRQRIGISDLDSLTDRLSRLVPAESASGRGVLGGLDTLLALSDAQGGPTLLQSRVAELDRRVGPRPCVSEIVGGRVVATVVGEGDLTDAYFALRTVSPRLGVVLDSARVSRSTVQVVPLDQLSAVFGKIRSLRPTCQYRIRVHIRTAYLAPVTQLGHYFDLVHAND